MRTRSLLLHPVFLLALALLLLNDHVLKAAFPGAATGKLSDVAGLVAWAWFFASVIPRPRLAAAAHATTALGFAWWKSPLADGFAAAWSAWAYPVTRVLDPTDLLALLVLPLSYWAWRRAAATSTAAFAKTRSRALAAARYGVAAVAVFAFAATSVDDDVPSFAWADTELAIDTAYVIGVPRAQLATTQFERFDADRGALFLGDTCYFFEFPLPVPDGFDRLSLEGEFALYSLDSARTVVRVGRSPRLTAEFPPTGEEGVEQVQDRLNGVTADSALTLLEGGPLLAWRLGQVYEPRPRLARCE